MPRAAVQDNERMTLRIKPEVKARLIRAAALRNTDLTHFVTETAQREADAVIQAAERLIVSERDFSRVLDLLEHPPKLNAKLRAVLAALPQTV